MAGCWLLDNMAPERPPIDVDAKDRPAVMEAAGGSRSGQVSMMASKDWSPPATVDVAKKRLYGSMGDYNTLSMQEAAFCNEMIQSTQFALIAPNWQYSRAYALGFETLCVEVLSVSTRAGDIRLALCAAFDWDSEDIKTDANALRALAEGKSEDELLETDDLKLIAATNPKYTYSFGMGLVVLMQMAGLDPEKAIPVWCEKLSLNCVNALSRDYAYYKSSLAKLEDLKEMLAQMKAASDKQKAERLKERQAQSEAVADSPSTPE